MLISSEHLFICCDHMCCKCHSVASLCIYCLVFSIDIGDGISLAIGSTQTKEVNSVVLVHQSVNKNPLPQSISAQSFRNPFDIARSCILEQLNRMRINFLHSTATTPNLVEEGGCVQEMCSPLTTHPLVPHNPQ